MITARADAPVAARAVIRESLVLGAWLLVACAIAAATLRAHVMWFDEVQAWNIARASRSLTDLFANVRYEGHPALWYLVLYAVSRVTGDPRAMQVVEWCVMCATFAVVLFRAPFPRWARATAIGGYFVAFEYGVVSRNYGLGLLLLVVALAALHRAPARPGLAAGVPLALLAWTSLAGALVVTVVVVAVAWERRSRPVARWAGALLVVAAGAALTCIPPSDFASFSAGIPSSPLAALTPTRVLGAATGPWRGLVPLPVQVGAWNTNLLDRFAGARVLEAVLSLVLVVLVGRALERGSVARRIWVLGAVAFFGYSLVVVQPDRAHYAGVWFVLFLACAWLACSERHFATSPSAPVPLVALVASVLAVQCAATFAILVPATTHDFSSGEALAAVIARQGLARDVVSGHDYDATTIGAYLDRPVYSAARREWIRYFVGNRRTVDAYAAATATDLVCRASALAAVRRRDVAYVVDQRLPERFHVTELGSELGVYVYRVRAGLAVCG